MFKKFKFTIFPSYNIRKFGKSVAIFIGVSLIAVPLFVAIPITYTFEINAINRDQQTYLKAVRYILDNVADSNDTVKLNVFSGGGSAYEGVRIYNAIRNSDATTITHNSGAAYSAGALIAMAGDEVTANEISTYLFHRAYYRTVFGKVLVGPEDPLYVMLQEFMELRMFPLFTPEEIELYNSGGDVNITGRDLTQRLGWSI